jgi:hypothetical protein
MLIMQKKRTTPSIQLRNQTIFERHKKGEDLKTIAKDFSLCKDSVRQIVEDVIEKQIQSAVSNELLTSIRQADDINRSWNRVVLLNAIEYPGRVRLLFDRHFYPDANEISLKQFMDWCLPEITDDSNNIYDWLPAYKINRFGNYNIRDLICYIDRMDFGQAFGNEWKKRRDAFRKKFAKSREAGVRDLL